MKAVCEKLDAEAILARMDPEIASRLRSLDVLPETDSTQAELARRAPADRHARAVLAETQNEGRGRRGRRWHSPPSGNVYLSLGWHFEAGTDELTFLPLVTAVTVAEALGRLGLKKHGIKWPNDLVVDGAKLGGCLVELQGEAGAGRVAVIGVGVNVRMAAASHEIGQAWTDLDAHLQGVSRNAVAASILDGLIGAVDVFSRRGFGPFRERWARYDLLAGRRVTLERAGETIEGTARGIGPRGGLLVENDAGTSELPAGEVTTWRAA